jgi:hypothetical protein
MLKNFHPPGEPVWPHPLRCGPFAVPKYSFMARRLAAAATSTLEMSGLVSVQKWRILVQNKAAAILQPQA